MVGSEEPISGALRYEATFEWDDGTETKGILEWDFEEKVYFLTDPTVVEKLLDCEKSLPLFCLSSYKTREITTVTSSGGNMPDVERVKDESIELPNAYRSWLE